MKILDEISKETSGFKLSERGLKEEDIKIALDPVENVAKRKIIGGPAPDTIKAEIKNKQKRMEKMQFLIEDIIHLNGAYARCSAEKETSVLSLHYNIDDLLSPYAQDLLYFAQNAKPRQGRYQIFFGKNGVDYKKA